MIILGKQIIETLENSVSFYPTMDSRFLQVSGIKFAFDPSKPKGSRIISDLVQIQDEYIDLEKVFFIIFFKIKLTFIKYCQNLKKTYTAVTVTYLQCGRDGFDCLKDSPILVIFD